MFFLLLAAALSTAAHASPTGPFLDAAGPIVMEDGVIEGGLVEDDALGGDTGEAADTGAIPVASCDVGRLRDGVALPHQPGLYTIWDARKAWGTPRLVDTLVYAAEEMLWRFPHAEPVMVGDMSYRRGGWMHGHKSHRGGLDADVGIYHGDAQQHQIGLRTVPASQMDLDANLTFVQVLLESGNVERILLDRRLIRALRDHAIQSGAMTEPEARAVFLLPGDPIGTSPWNLTGVVHHVPGHHHHFHVRVRCGD